MNYILTMTLSGSCLFILYQVVRLCMKDKLSEQWYYRLLKIVTLYYLLPLPFMKRYYKNFIGMLRGVNGHVFTEYYMRDDMILFVDDAEIIFNKTAILEVNIFGVWIIVSGLIGTIFLVNYINKRKKLSKLLVENEENLEKETHLLNKCINDIKIRRRVEIRKCGYDQSAFTIGFFKPIIFYNYNMKQTEKEMLLLHELTHIKRNDMFWKFVQILVIAIHWYNPLVWWFKKSFNDTCEYACDESVIQNKSGEFCRDYARLLIECVAENQKGEYLEAHLSKSAIEVEKRMKKIIVKKSKCSKFAGSMLTLVLVLLNSLTVFAYEDVKIARGEVFIEESFGECDFVFVPDDADGGWGSDYVYHFECQFVDEEGNVYEVNEGISIFAECAHEYVSGEIQKHYLYEDGSCKVEYYKALRCSKCGNVIYQDCYSTRTWDECTH